MVILGALCNTSHNITATQHSIYNKLYGLFSYLHNQKMDTLKKHFQFYNFLKVHSYDLKRISYETI